MSETKYHQPESCNKCGGENNYLKTIYEDSYLTEAYTECIKCGFKDLWAHGFFESGDSMVSRCKKYVNRGGKLIGVSDE